MSFYHKIIDLQKLHAAWKNVSKSKPATGVDHVSFDQFEMNKAEELKQLQLE